MGMVYLTFAIWWARIFYGLRLMCNSFNNSISPFFKSQRFEFKGKSLRIQWFLMALFANWLHKILKIKNVTVYGANILFVCLVARPLWIFWGRGRWKEPYAMATVTRTAILLVISISVLSIGLWAKSLKHLTQEVGTHKDLQKFINAILDIT